MNAPTTQIAKTITNISRAKYVLKYTNCLHKQGTAARRKQKTSRNS